MAEFPNPPLITGPAPTDGQIAVYQASTNTWIAQTAASTGITVPGTHIAAASAPSAETASAVVAANAATQTGSYVQADVQTIATLSNAEKTTVNALVTDVGTLVTELGALTTKVNTLLTELQTAGILAAS